MNTLPFRITVMLLAFALGVALFNLGATYNEMVEETEKARLIQTRPAATREIPIPNRLTVVDDIYSRRCSESRPANPAANYSREDARRLSSCHKEWAEARHEAVVAEGLQNLMKR